MNKRSAEARDLLERTMRAHGWDRAELADKVGMSRRTIDAVMRGEIPLSKNLEAHLQTLLELPAAGGARVREEEGTYRGLIKKVTFIEEEGTPEQVEMMDSFLEALAKQLGRGKERAKEPPPGKGK